MTSGGVIVTAVVPAAGYGTRMNALTGGVIPKEMLATPRGPVIRLIMEELIESGIETVVVVLRPGGDVVREYLLALNRDMELSPRHLELVFVYQSPERTGNGGAILSAVDVLGHSDFIVVWADEILSGTPPRAEELVCSFNARGGSVPVIALTTVTEAEVSKCGIAKIGKWLSPEEAIVTDVIEKPPLHLAPSRYGSIGGCVMTVDLLAALRDIRRDRTGRSTCHPLFRCTRNLTRFSAAWSPPSGTKSAVWMGILARS